MEKKVQRLNQMFKQELISITVSDGSITKFADGEENRYPAY